ncbi:Protein of unknown function [Flavobacterium indicum GPTSA100-9 = DSM 17447]|uniref:NACHT domain-containing protein n=1 Tax=Flavobacterium indicum (strain DSM 17447 / CIP 109464 / GPTSA100-9) TaxID=1094466 RepID=H8XNK4_FLAIG|nr:NACHT domain-containing protein [Flavobacterium indicum]CCG52121.1 Protein of unknown function [Flavobacterium indicum GPTSA100-9 = DSM 17447]
MIKEIIIKEAAKEVFKYSTTFLKKNFNKLLSKEKDIYDSLNEHIQKVKNWSNEITFKDLKSSKVMSQVFIELDMYVYPRNIRIDESEKILKIPLNKIFDVETKHLLILGQPGAGKTTSMKYLCHSIFFNDNTSFQKYKYPILVKLRDLNKPINSKNKSGMLFEYIFNLLGLSLDIRENQSEEEIIRTKQKLVLYLLNKLNVILIIEGFDELSYKKHREIILFEIGELANFLEDSRLIITSRTSDFNYHFENITPFELCSLNEEQISLFATKWLIEENKINSFLSEVYKSPFIDTAVRPLTIAHLCAIYERVGKIPEKPKTVYKKIVNLLLEEWDEQRNIKRVSKYSDFEIDRKFEFLTSIAYHLTVNNKKSIFSTSTLENLYFKIYNDFDLDRKDSKNVLEELETHTGLFIQAGYELYEFAHKSLQEYLTAEYIVKLPSIPENLNVISSIPNELAITISISSNPSFYFTELVQKRFKNMKLNFQFYQIFLTRLMIEKPDFNKTSKVGIAAFQLYSMYLYQNKSLNQLKLFIEDDLVSEFEVFINSIFKRNAKDFVEKFYEIESEETSTNGFIIITLNKKKSISIGKSFELTSRDLPQKLLCRSSFI